MVLYSRFVFIHISHLPSFFTTALSHSNLRTDEQALYCSWTLKLLMNEICEKGYHCLSLPNHILTLCTYKGWSSAQHRSGRIHKLHYSYLFSATESHLKMVGQSRHVQNIFALSLLIIKPFCQQNTRPVKEQGNWYRMMTCVWHHV